jgi:NADPH:quinone reductase-like Zn-dependent oxidoreductase
LINGASGSLGTYAVQFAKGRGAMITGICRSENFDLVRSLGADNVIDYTKEDISARNDDFDIIFDAVGKLSRSKCKKLLKKKGKFITTNGLEKIGPGDLGIIRSMIEDGKLRPVIDRIYPFDQIVEAHKYVDKGHKKGNVGITVHS